MANEHKSGSDTKNIGELARGILSGRIFTSRHVWVLAEGNENKYLDMLKKVFHPDTITRHLSTLENLLVSDLFNGTLFYGDIKDSKIPFDMRDVSPTHLPHFTDIEFVFGDELKQLDETLKGTYKDAMQ